MTLRLLIGSGNAGKVMEYRRILAGLDVELVAPDELLDPVVEPAEEADNFADNARVKAAAYREATGMAAIADDSGLEVSVLGGAPGVRSRRYFGERGGPAERNQRLLALLNTADDRAARFVCVIALALPGQGIELFEGEVRGEIAREPRGSGGFGYDPIFVIAGDGRTMGELSGSEKDQLSHRGMAGAKLRARLSAEAR